MPTYDVHMTLTVSTTVTVEADSPGQAMELVYDSDDMPGPMVYGAFGQASVDEAGEWEPVAVYEGDEEVWSDRT